MKEPDPSPPPVPKRVLSYQPSHSQKKVRAFGSVRANAAIGAAAIVVGGLISYAMVRQFPRQPTWVYWWPVLSMLVIGAVAACFSRYRGVLTGMISILMLLVLIGIGLLLLAIGMCFSGNLKI